MFRRFAKSTVPVTAVAQCGQGCPHSELLLWLHENRVVNVDVMFHFGEFDREVRVLDNVNGEGDFHAINFAIVLVFNGVSDLSRSVPLFSAQQQPSYGIEIETSRATV